MGGEPVDRTLKIQGFVASFLESKGLLPEGSRILVACSGGVDSTALLYILHRLAPGKNWRLSVAHYDHQVRESSREDAEFVAGMAKNLRIPFFLGQAPKLSGGSESQWREFRYRFLSEVARERTIPWVALGHTLDDQAETVLLRACRFASGSRSLGGMKVLRNLGEEGPKLVRPLLGLKRKALEGYLDKLGVPCREDETNRDLGFLRNRVRHRVLPFLSRWVDPKVSEHLAGSARLMADEDSYLEEECAKERNLLVTESARDFSIHVPGFRSLHVALQRRLLRMLLKSETRTDSLEQVRLWILSQQTNLAHDLPRGLRACKEGDKASFWREQLDVPFTQLQVPGQACWGRWLLRAEYDDSKTAIQAARENPWVAAVRADRLRLPLRIRSWLPGDRFTPLGMCGTQKLHDFFINQKVPRRRRTSVPLVLSESSVVWVVGHRIDERFRVDHETRRTVRITAEE